MDGTAAWQGGPLAVATSHSSEGLTNGMKARLPVNECDCGLVVVPAVVGVARASERIARAT